MEIKNEYLSELLKTITTNKVRLLDIEKEIKSIYHKTEYLFTNKILCNNDIRRLFTTYSYLSGVYDKIYLEQGVLINVIEFFINYYEEKSTKCCKMSGEFVFFISLN